MMFMMVIMVINMKRPKKDEGEENQGVDAGENLRLLWRVASRQCEVEAGGGFPHDEDRAGGVSQKRLVGNSMTACSVHCSGAYSTWALHPKGRTTTEMQSVAKTSGQNLPPIPKLLSRTSKPEAEAVTSHPFRAPAVAARTPEMSIAKN